ncbi:MAG: T9SS type A sorting domain-containing protein [Bacteroidetes bacterium]|nr:T9SS type A sorting domain-containing protein [Bacteroidota bacterium]
MKGSRWSMYTAWVFRAAVLVAVLSPSEAGATVHVIRFGGEFGNSYTPNELAVAVGDTVRWQGDFGFHPLSSTAVPAGAGAFTSASGSVFNYVVPAPGNYNYTCDSHGPGMSGSFIAVVSAVDEGTAQPGRFELRQNYPNPFNPSTTIGYQVPGVAASWVKLAVFNLIGQEVAELVNGLRNAGNHVVTFDASNLPSGIYVYQLSASGFSSTRTMVLVR